MARIRVGISGLALPAVARRLLPRGPAAAARAGVRRPKLTSIEINGSFYSLQRPNSYRSWRERDARRLRLRGQGRPLHHPHEEAARRRAAAGQLLRLGRAGARAEARSVPVAAAADARLRRRPAGDFFDLLPRTTGEAAALAARHDDRLAGDRAWTAVDADRPLRHALEVRHDSFLDAGVLAAAARHDSRWSSPTRPGNGPHRGRHRRLRLRAAARRPRSSTPAATPTRRWTAGPPS